MIPVLHWTADLYQYLSEILPERIAILFHQEEWNLSANTDISNFTAAEFRYSVPLPMIESRRDLIDSINDNFRIYKTIIEDGNEFYNDSIYSQNDLTQYQIIDYKHSEIDLIDKVSSCGSWRSYGMIFSEDMDKFGIYVGAFDDEGYLMFTFSSMVKDKITEIYYNTSADI